MNIKEIRDLIIKIWKPSIDSLKREKQENLQFQDEGIDIGDTGEVRTINFIGTGVTASVSSNTLEVDIPNTSASDENYNKSLLLGGM